MTSPKPLSVCAVALAAALRRVTPYHDLLPLSAIAQIREALRDYDEAVQAVKAENTGPGEP